MNDNVAGFICEVCGRAVYNTALAPICNKCRLPADRKTYVTLDRIGKVCRLNWFRYDPKEDVDAINQTAHLRGRAGWWVILLMAWDALWRSPYSYVTLTSDGMVKHGPMHPGDTAHVIRDKREDLL
jgi:hypothetical protein